MDYDDFRQEIPANLLRGAAGFFGTLAAIFLLPRLMRFALTNYLFRAMAEIVAIVTFGLLTERFAKWVSGPNHEKVKPRERVRPPRVGEPVS